MLLLKKNNKGMLVLSKTAGASSELGEALLVNVNNKEKLAEALARALNMKEDEQTGRMELMRNRLFEYDVFQWARGFVEIIKELKRIQAQHKHQKLDKNMAIKLLR